MFIRDYFKMAFSLFYRRRGLHFVEIGIICLSLCVFMHGIGSLYDSYQGIIQVKQLLSVPSEELYKVRFGNITNLSGKNSADISNFVSKLKKSPKFDVSGRYFYEASTFVNEENDSIYAEVLYMDEALLPICSIKSSVTKKRISLASDNYVGIAVGSELKKHMPLGSIWYDDYYDVYYEVTDHIQCDEEWFYDYMIGGSGTKNLNNIILADASEQVCNPSNFFLSFVYMNHVFVAADGRDEEELADYVAECAKEYDLPVYITSVEKMKEDYINYYKTYLNRINMQTVIFTIMSLTGIYILILLLFDLQKNTIYIMSIYGLGYRQAKKVFGMVYAIIYPAGLLAAYMINFYITKPWSGLQNKGVSLLMKLCCFTVLVFYIINCGILFGRIKEIYKRGNVI